MQTLSLRKYAETIGVSHTAVAKAVKVGYISKGWDPVTKKIIVDLANNEWGNDIKQKNNQTKAEKNTIESFNESHLTEQAYHSTSEELTLSEAKRRREIYNAEIARIAALKEQGLYVDKQIVYKRLFDYGSQIRISLQNIPDRIIDSILSSQNRFEAHSILLNAINDALEQLSNPPKIN